MGSGKKIAAGIALVVVIALAVWFIVAATTDRAPAAPPIITGMAITKVDSKTFDVKTLSLSEWQAVGERDGIYLNSATGEYTMSPAMECAQCNKVIPDPVAPADVVGDIGKIPAWKAAVKCPLCGENPF